MLLCIAVQLLAGNGHIINVPAKPVVLTGNDIEVLVDNTKQLTAQAAFKALALKPAGLKPSELYNVQGNIWVKFIVANTSATADYVLNINYPLLKHVMLYKFKGYDIQAYQIEGLTDTVNKRKYKNQDFIFDLGLQPGDTATYLVEIQSEVPVILPLRIGTAESIKALDDKTDIITGIYVGIILSLFLYNCFIYFSTRDRSYLYYLIYIIFFALTQLVLQGYGQRLLWPMHPAFTPPLLIFFVAIAGISGIYFARHFLQIKKAAPWADKVFIFFALVYLAAVIVLLTGGFSYSFRMIDINVSALVIFSFVISLIIARKGSSTALFFLISWSLFMVCMLVFTGRNFGLIPYNNFSNYILYIGSSAQAILLSIALANRINTYKKEKENLLQQINIHQQNMINEIIVAQEEERKRVAADLHDDVGPTLNILAMHISNLPGIINGRDDIEQYYQKGLQLSNKAAADIRTIAHNLLPKDFSNAGLFAILEEKVAELNACSDIRFVFIKEGDDTQLSEIFLITIYRIINEILNNILKHSQAKEAFIQLLIDKTQIQVMAEDDGIGFTTKTAAKGIGIKSITRRVEFLKGSIIIDSTTSGTHIIVSIPV